MHNPSSTTVVAFFVRVPVVGQVKTRLAAELGAEGACRLYEAMVADILSNIKACALPLYLFHDGNAGAELPQAWVEASSEVRAQHGEQIGERMAAAFEHCFAENISQVIMVGSDIPGLNAEIIDKASVALASHDAAIAPVIDGGYCLIALKRERYHQRIFEDIPWSTDQVLRVTLNRFEECKLAACLLQTMQDIDTIDDLNTYCRNPLPTALATNRTLLGTLGKTPIAPKIWTNR